jgi:hypothetical protein
MSNAAEANFPTMIIPRGTEIRLNAQGQLSIKTPGNLVIQNSGAYSELESTNGSIRIEENVSVDAVSVRAAQACFIQGTLTAWKVKARKIALEDRAKAYIMLQESEQLELSKSSRLVGNFGTEREIYLMLGKFSHQLKELPAAVDINAPASLGDGSASTTTTTTTQLPVRTPEKLQQALAILELEVRKPDLDPQSSEALREVVFALREHDYNRASLIYRDAFRELRSPSEQLRNAYALLDGHFAH